MKPDQQFPTLIIEKEDRFHCMIKELAIFESGDTLPTAYEKAQKKREKILSQVKSSGLEPYFFLTTETPKKKWFHSTLNYLLLGCFLMVPILSLTQPISSLLSKVSRAIPMNPIETVIGFGNRLKNLPPEKKEELRDAAHIIFSELDLMVHSDLEGSEKN
ncbi:MAG TPA: hypothetical protein VLE96_03290 [Chlamydiales bacterium]|nr:hypothetical protein [Chlamydiales bacterium]